MVDLSARPYYLQAEDIQWVKDTIAAMTLEEKIGQLFVNMGSSREEAYLKNMTQNYHIGAVRYNPAPAAEVYEQNRILQESAKVPLLIAANTEAGGNGACTDGTEVGLEVKIGATDDVRYAYEMGRVAGVEAAAVGCNWSFAPIVDIMYNWRNPIISGRSFANDPDKVLAMALAYMKGIRESGIAPAAKHFPGDGVDERDQHLSFSVNSLSCQEWDQTYGKVYRGLIEADLPSIMAGHIHLPAYSRYFNPALAGKHTLPATLSKELLTDLLRGRLGFNGLIVTDASHMVGMTSAMKRSEILPAAIAAGCDLFLFFNDPDEDFEYMMRGYQTGVITEERLEEALYRILGLKAHLGLHRKAKTELLPPKAEALARIGLPENKKLFREVADKAITLVRQEPGVLPLTPRKYPRILLVESKGVEGGFGELLGGGNQPARWMKESLQARGFAVTIYQSPASKPVEPSKEGVRQNIGAVYSRKAPIRQITDNYDLVINLVNVNPSTVQRPVWPLSKGTPDVPFYVHELPALVISVQCPYHLADIPQALTYINTYDSRQVTLEVLTEKLTGKSSFTGVSNIDVLCGDLLDY